MLAVAEHIASVETEMSSQPPVITTLYDLIAAFQDEVEPWEEDVVTAAVVDLCNRGRLRFLDLPKNSAVVCA